MHKQHGGRWNIDTMVATEANNGAETYAAGRAGMEATQGGTVPVRLLYSRISALREVRLHTPLERGPVSWLCDSRNVLRTEQTKRSVSTAARQHETSYATDNGAHKMTGGGCKAQIHQAPTKLQSLHGPESRALTSQESGWRNDT